MNNWKARIKRSKEAASRLEARVKQRARREWRANRKRDGVSLRKHLAVDRPKVYLANEVKVLRVRNEFFCAGAVWVRKDGIWACKMAAPILHWMIGMSPLETKLELARKGCSWEWLEGSPVVEKGPNAGLDPTLNNTPNFLAKSPKVPRTQGLHLLPRSGQQSGTASPSSGSLPDPGFYH